MEMRSEYHLGTIFDNINLRKDNCKMDIIVQPDFKIHELKTDPEPYNDIEEGTKKATIRINDREFNEGDYLVLRKTKYTGEQMASKSESYPLVYTGKALMCKVTHIHSGPGMAFNWVAMSFEIIDRFPGKVG